MLTTIAIFFINSRFYFILRHLVSKFNSGRLQEVKLATSYSYCKVNYSRASTNNLEIIYKSFQMQLLNLMFQDLHHVELETNQLDKCQDLTSNPPSKPGDYAQQVTVQVLSTYWVFTKLFSSGDLCKKLVCKCQIVSNFNFMSTLLN